MNCPRIFGLWWPVDLLTRDAAGAWWPWQTWNEQNAGLLWEQYNVPFASWTLWEIFRCLVRYMFALAKMKFSKKTRLDQWIDNRSMVSSTVDWRTNRSLIIPSLISHIACVTLNTKRLTEDPLILTTKQQKWREWWRGRRWKWSSQRIRWLTVPLGGQWWAVQRDQQQASQPKMKGRYTEAGILNSTLWNPDL